jgi:hypothetical protein
MMKHADVSTFEFEVIMYQVRVHVCIVQTQSGVLQFVVPSTLSVCPPDQIVDS